MRHVFLNPLLVFGLLAAGCSPSAVITQDQGVELARATTVETSPSQIELAPGPLTKDLKQSQDKEDKIQPEKTEQLVIDLCSQSFTKRQAAIYELNQRLTASKLQSLLKNKLVDPDCWSFALDAMEKQGNLDDDTLSDALVKLAGEMDLADRQKTRRVEKRFDPYFERLLRKVRKKGDPGPPLKKLVNRLKDLAKSDNKGPAVVIFVKVLEYAEKEIARHPEIINQLGAPVAEAIREGVFDDQKTSLKFLDLVERHAAQQVQATVYTHIASGIREGGMTNENIAAALLDKVKRANRAIIDGVVAPLAEALKEKGVVLTDALAQRSVELFKQVSQPARRRALGLVAQGVESGTVNNTVTIAGIRDVADTFGRTGWDVIAPYFARRIRATGRLGNDVNAREALRSIRNVASQAVRVQTAQAVAQGVEQRNVAHVPTVTELLNMTGGDIAALESAAPHLARTIAQTGSLVTDLLAQRFLPTVQHASQAVSDQVLTTVATGMADGTVGNQVTSVALLNLANSLHAHGLDLVTPIITGGIRNNRVTNDAVAQRFFAVVGGAAALVQTNAADTLLQAIRRGPGVANNISDNGILRGSCTYIANQALDPGGAGAGVDLVRVQAIVDAVVPNLGQGAEGANGRQDAVMNSMLRPVVGNLTLAICDQLDRTDPNVLGYGNGGANPNWFKNRYRNRIQNLPVAKNADATETLFDVMRRHEGGGDAEVRTDASGAIQASINNAGGSLELKPTTTAHLVRIMKTGGAAAGFVAGSDDDVKTTAAGVLDAVARRFAQNNPPSRAEYHKLLVELLGIRDVGQPNGYAGGVVLDENNFNAIRNKLNNEWAALGNQHQNSVIQLALDPSQAANPIPDYAMDAAYEVITHGGHNVLQDPNKIDDLDVHLKDLVDEYVSNGPRYFNSYQALTAAGYLGEQTAKALVDKLLETPVVGAIGSKANTLKGFLTQNTHQIKMNADGSTAASLIQAVGKHGDAAVGGGGGSFLVDEFLPKALAAHGGEKYKALEPLVKSLEIPDGAPWDGAGNNPDANNLPWNKIATALHGKWADLSAGQKQRVQAAIDRDGTDGNPAFATAARQGVLDVKIKQALDRDTPHDGIELVNLSVAYGNLFSRYAEENFKSYLLTYNGNYHFGVGGPFDIIAKTKFVKPILEHVLTKFQDNSTFPTKDIADAVVAGTVLGKRERVLGMFRRTLRNLAGAHQKDVRPIANGGTDHDITDLTVFPRGFAPGVFNYVSGSIDLPDTTMNLLVGMVRDNRPHANEIVFDYILPLVMVGDANVQKGIDNMRKLLNALLADGADTRGKLPTFNNLKARLEAVRPRDEHLLIARGFPDNGGGGAINHDHTSVANMKRYAELLNVKIDSTGANDSLEERYENARTGGGGDVNLAFPAPLP